MAGPCPWSSREEKRERGTGRRGSLSWSPGGGVGGGSPWRTRRCRLLHVDSVACCSAEFVFLGSESLWAEFGGLGGLGSNHP